MFQHIYSSNTKMRAVFHIPCTRHTLEQRCWRPLHFDFEANRDHPKSSRIREISDLFQIKRVPKNEFKYARSSRMIYISCVKNTKNIKNVKISTKFLKLICNRDSRHDGAKYFLKLAKITNSHPKCSLTKTFEKNRYYSYSITFIKV